MSDFRIYRANKDMTKGSASAWQLSYKEDNKYEPFMVFLTLAKQTGENDKGDATFAWKEGQIVVKLGSNDLGEIISYLDGFSENFGYKGSLFHETPNGGNKIINLTRNDNGFYLKVSQQTADKVNSSISHSISRGEAAVLTALLKSAIVKIYNW